MMVPTQSSSCHAACPTVPHWLEVWYGRGNSELTSPTLSSSRDSKAIVGTSRADTRVQELKTSRPNSLLAHLISCEPTCLQTSVTNPVSCLTTWVDSPKGASVAGIKIRPDGVTLLSTLWSMEKGRRLYCMGPGQWITHPRVPRRTCFIFPAISWC